MRRRRIDGEATVKADGATGPAGLDPRKWRRGVPFIDGPVLAMLLTLLFLPSTLTSS